ncbi:MAG: sigma-70 family RNA polymerase sigma factor [Planctomycetota bacterium]
MGDADATIHELLEHAGWLQELARRMVGEAGADDAVQEVWLRAARRPPGEVRWPRAWLGAVLRSVHLRRLARGDAAAARERGAAAAEALPSASELTERAEAQRWLVEAVLALDERTRHAVLLHFFEGLSAAEIARRGAEPSSTVRNRIARGLVQLRERLDARPGGRHAWLPGLTLLAAPERGALLSTPWTAGLGAAGTFAMGKLVASAFVLVALVAAGFFLLNEPPATEPAGEPATQASLPEPAPPADGPGDPLAAPVTAASSGDRRVTAEPSAAPTALPAETEPPPPAPGTVFGQVLDPDGQPVAGATVYEGTLGQVAMSLRRPENPRRPSVESDAAGRFALALGEPRGVVLSAWADGFAASAELALDLTDASSGEECVLRLRAGASVSGTVYGIDRQPIGGRMVQVASPDLGEFRTVLTEGDGTYELHTLNPGPWRAATYPSDDELADAGKSGGTMAAMSYLEQAEFTLEDGAALVVPLGFVDVDAPRVHGRLLRDGEPVGGMMQWYPAARPMEKKVSSADSEGRFEVDLPEPGAWVVHANIVGSSSRGLRRTLELAPAADEEIELNLVGAELAGRVVDVQGTPVAGVRVELRVVAGAPHQPDPTLGGDSARSGEDGRYAFELLAPGTYVVVAHGSAPDAGDALGRLLGAAVSDPLEVAGERSIEAPDLAVPDGVCLDVLVRDATARAVSGASLYFHDAQGRPLNPATMSRSASDGSATSPAFGRGRVWVTAVHRTGASPTAAVDVDPGAGAPDAVELVLGQAHWIELDAGAGWVDPTRDHVSVTDAGGRRWAGLVDIRSLFEARPGRDVPRRPLFGPLPVGSYAVRVERPDGAVLEGALALTASAPAVSTLAVR